MPTYITLIKWTDEGIKRVKDAPKRIQRARDAYKSVGGEMKDFYFLFGKYDMMAIAEVPSDEAMAKAVLMTARYGQASIETVKAFTEAEGIKIIEGLP
jgi:uncharacterized protein with GYD domain